MDLDGRRLFEASLAMVTPMRIGICGLALALLGCAARPADPPDSLETWWINSYRMPCVGVGPMQCLQVHQDARPLAPWRLFYSEIVGFEFEPGSLARLRVRLVELPRNQVPADGSSIRFELVEVLERIPDPRNGLHDIFVLVSPLDAHSEMAPPERRQTWVEFNIVQARYAGHDGCGAFGGDILSVDGERLELSPAHVTRDACAGEQAAEAFREGLARTRTWQRDGMRLVLADEAGVVRLEFRKVD